MDKDVAINSNMITWLIFKRFFDFISSIILAVILSPLLLLISIVVFYESSGVIIFAHKRIGQNGQEFNCYKFRTMVTNAQAVIYEYLEQNPEAKEEWRKSFKLKHDPRITKIGAYLRRTSLDELPQLFNVIKGDMSLVGIRPVTNTELHNYYHSNLYEYYLLRPGITGFWQVNGRSNTSYAERVQMDSWYVNNWSFLQDIKILIKTIKVTLNKSGAY